MESEENKTNTAIGKMRKHTEKMADGERYIIYYNFREKDHEIATDGLLEQLSDESKEVESNV